MGDGRWSGGAANRTWARPGSRRVIEGDAERGARLWAAMKDEPFLCETCGMMHPLREHRECRAADFARGNRRPA
jgi:hypothetical protein